MAEVGESISGTHDLAEVVDGKAEGASDDIHEEASGVLDPEAVAAVGAETDRELVLRVVVADGRGGAPLLIENLRPPEVVDSHLVLALEGLHEFGHRCPEGNVGRLQVDHALLLDHRFHLSFVDEDAALPRADDEL